MISCANQDEMHELAFVIERCGWAMMEGYLCVIRAKRNQPTLLNVMLRWHCRRCVC
jgi:hypothetical protein